MASKAIWYDYVTISSVSKVSNLAGEKLHSDAKTSESGENAVIAFRDSEDDRMKYYLFDDQVKAKQLFIFIMDKEM